MHRSIALLLLVASAPAGADIYKWTDENGRVHFGDSAAGAGKKAEAVAPGTRRNATPPTDATPDAEQTKLRQRRLLEALQREQAEREAATERQADVRHRQEGECQRLRDTLQNMEGRVVYTTGADGEPQYLDDTQRQDYVDKAKRHLEQNCH